ncbi:serine-rich adhesin for platelets [Schistocerca americana]|uniref:serine-rich adhesin for platelets n=1 Tax=Schistocerca americana TaxID=7009 RepID=UPI001F4FF29A|nr:serine-rich adhesin for platelets [Schistocerca americana]
MPFVDDKEAPCVLDCHVVRAGVLVLLQVGDMERPRRLPRPLLLLVLAALVAPVRAGPLQGPHADPEVDGEESRKVLGSSVVTSVSVIMDLGDGTKAYLADAVGRPLRPASGSPPPGSPAALLSPDRYEFYTFDEQGDLVRRHMTLAQIQGLLAAGGQPLRLRLRPRPQQPQPEDGQAQPALLSAEEDAGAGQDSDDVRHVVESVQSVLRGALDKVSSSGAQKPPPPAAPQPPPTAAPSPAAATTAAAPASQRPGSSTRRPAPNRRPPSRPQYRPSSPRPVGQTRRPPLRPAASTIKPVVSTANSIISTVKPTRRPPPTRWTTSPTTHTEATTVADKSPSKLPYKTTTTVAEIVTTTASSPPIVPITKPTKIKTTVKPATAIPPKAPSTAATTTEPTTAIPITTIKPTFFRKPTINTTTTPRITTTTTTTSTTTTPTTRIATTTSPIPTTTTPKPTITTTTSTTTPASTTTTSTTTPTTTTSTTTPTTTTSTTTPTTTTSTTTPTTTTSTTTPTTTTSTTTPTTTTSTTTPTTTTSTTTPTTTTSTTTPTTTTSTTTPTTTTSTTTPTTTTSTTTPTSTTTTSTTTPTSTTTSTTITTTSTTNPTSTTSASPMIPTTTTTTTTERITATATTTSPTATTTAEQQTVSTQSVEVEQTTKKFSVPPSFVEITPRPVTRPPTSTTASTSTTVGDTLPTQESSISTTIGTPLSTIDWPRDEDNAPGTISQNLETTTAASTGTTSSPKPPASPEPAPESVSLSAPFHATHKPVYVPQPGETPLDVSFTALPLDGSTQKGATETEEAWINTEDPTTMQTEAPSSVSEFRNESTSDSLLLRPDSGAGVSEDAVDVSPSTESSTQFTSTYQPSPLTTDKEMNASQMNIMASPAPSTSPADNLPVGEIASDASQILNVAAEIAESTAVSVDLSSTEKVSEKPVINALQDTSGADDSSFNVNATDTQLNDLEKYGTQNSSIVKSSVQESDSVPEKSTVGAQGTTETEASIAPDNLTLFDTTEKLSELSSDVINGLSTENLQLEGQKSPEGMKEQKPSSDANGFDGGLENSNNLTDTERPEEQELSTEKDFLGIQNIITGDSNGGGPIPVELLDSLSSVLSQVSDSEKVTEIYDEKPGSISDFTGMELGAVGVKETSNSTGYVSIADLGTIAPEAFFSESVAQTSSSVDRLQDVSTLTSVIVGSRSTTQSTLLVDGANAGQKDDEVATKPEPISEAIKNSRPESGSVSEESKWEMISQSAAQQTGGYKVEIKSKVNDSSVSELLSSDVAAVSATGFRNETITDTDTLSLETTDTTAESTDTDVEHFVTPQVSDYETPLSETEGAIATSADAPPSDVLTSAYDVSASDVATEHEEIVTTSVHVVGTSEEGATTGPVPTGDSDKLDDEVSSEQEENADTAAVQENVAGQENSSDELLSDGSASGASVQVHSAPETAKPEEEATMASDSVSSYTVTPEEDSDSALDVKDIAAESSDESGTTPGPEASNAAPELNADKTKNKPPVTIVKGPEQDTITMEMETTYSSGLKDESMSGIPVDTGDLIVSKIDSGATSDSQNDDLLQDPVTESQKLQEAPASPISAMGDDFNNKVGPTAETLPSDEPGTGGSESVGATKISVVTATSSSLESIKDSATVSQEERIPGEGLGTGETSVHVLSQQVAEKSPEFSLQKLDEKPLVASSGDSSISPLNRDKDDASPSNDEDGSNASSSEDVVSITTIISDSKTSPPPTGSSTESGEFTITPLPANIATEMKEGQETTTPSKKLSSSTVRISATPDSLMSTSQPSGTILETAQSLKVEATDDTAVNAETILSQQADDKDSLKDDTEEIKPPIKNPTTMSVTEELATARIPDDSPSSSTPDRISATTANDSGVYLSEFAAESQEQDTVKSTELEAAGGPSSAEATATPAAMAGSSGLPEEGSAATFSESVTFKDQLAPDLSNANNQETLGMNDAVSADTVTAPNTSTQNLDEKTPEENISADAGTDELQASSSSNNLPGTVLENDASDAQEEDDVPENTTPILESAESSLNEEPDAQKIGLVDIASTEPTSSLFDKEAQMVPTGSSSASEALHSSETSLSSNIKSTSDSATDSQSEEQHVAESDSTAEVSQKDDEDYSGHSEEKIAAKLSDEASPGVSASGISVVKGDKLGEGESSLAASSQGDLSSQSPGGSAPDSTEADVKDTATDGEEPIFIKINPPLAVNGDAGTHASSEIKKIPVQYHSAIDVPSRIHSVVAPTVTSSEEVSPSAIRDEKPAYVVRIEAPDRKVPTGEGDGAAPETEDIPAVSVPEYGDQSQGQAVEDATGSDGQATDAQHTFSVEDASQSQRPPEIPSASPSIIIESVTAQPAAPAQSSSPAGGLLPPEVSWPQEGEVEEPERPPVDLRPADAAHQLGLEATTAALDGDVRAFADLLNELALRLWAGVAARGLNTASAPPRSLVLSPFALTSLLAMVFLGARGPTSDQMNDLLRLDDVVTFNPHLVLRNVTDSLVHGNPPGVAAVAFVRQLYSDKSKGKLLEFYKERAQQWYEGHVEEADWSAVGDLVRRRTNLLVRRQTRGRVHEFVRGAGLALRPPLAAFTASVFQTDCSGASTEGRDGEMYFTVSPSPRQRRLVPVPAAVWSEGVHAGYDPHIDATVAAIGADTPVSVVLALPGQQGQVAPGDGLSALERRLLTPEGWARALRCVAPRRGLQLQAPRFAHRSLLNATAALRRLGLRDLLTRGRADLRGLSGGLADLHLADVLAATQLSTCAGHSAHAEVSCPSAPVFPQRAAGRARRLDYDDTDAEVLQLPLALRPRQARRPAAAARLSFNRPFFYAVRHNPTGIILHMGRFNPRLIH